MTKLSQLVSSLALCVGLLACGGDGGGPAGDTKLSDLTAEEQKALCQELDDAARESAEGIGRFTCLLGQIFSGTCSDAEVDTCTEEFVAELLAEERDCSEMNEALVGCDATLDEFRACIDESLLAFAEFEDATCDDIEVGGTSDGQSEACEAFNQECPGFFDGGDDE